MENLPIYLSLAFGAVTLLTVLIFYFASQQSKTSLLIILGFLALQTIAGLKGFFTVTDSTPPRFLLLILPPVILIVSLFITRKGQLYLDRFDIGKLTLLHAVRIPVELVLLGLFTYQTIPELMTFEGRNFDILSGITALFVYYFGFVRRNLSRRFLLAWNFICLGLLVNIVVNAILAAPFPFQQFAFDQPNIAILHFPFVWLPGCVVPLVLFSHLVSIRQLVSEQKSEKTIATVNEKNPALEQQPAGI